MKRKTIRLIGYMGGLAVLTGVYFGVEKWNEQLAAEEEQTEDVTMVLNYDSDQIKALKFLADKKEILFEKDEKGIWKLKGEPEFPVDQTAVSQAVNAISSVEAQYVIENAENPEQYELDAPANTLVITDTDGQETSVGVGMKDSDGNYYIYLNEDKSTVYLIQGGAVTPFEKKLYDYAEMEQFPTLETDAITEIGVEQQDRFYEMIKDRNNFWEVSGEKEEHVFEEERSDSTKANTLVSSICSLTFETFVDYHCIDYAKYGLEKPMGRIRVVYEEETASEEASKKDGDESAEVIAAEEAEEPAEGTEKETIEGREKEEAEKAAEEAEEENAEEAEEETVEETEKEAAEKISEKEAEGSQEESLEEASEKAEMENTEQNTEESTTEKEPEMISKEVVLKIGNRADGTSYYVNLEGSDDIYTMSEEALTEILEKEVNDFWNLNVFYLSVNDLESLKVKSEGKICTYDVSRETVTEEDGTEKETISYKKGTEEVDSLKFTSFYNKLINLYAVERLVDSAETYGKEYLQAEFISCKGEKTEMTIYEYDVNYDLVVCEGKEFLLNKSSVRELDEALKEIQ